MLLGNFRSSILVVYIVATASSDFVPCEARKSFDTSRLRGLRIPDDSVFQPVKKLRTSSESDTGAPFNSPNPYGTVPHFSLPPLDSIAPSPPPPPHDRITSPRHCLLPPGSCGPNPPELALGPPLCSPPVAHPPAPPKGQVYAVWCVAKPTVPDAIIQAAMDYACWAGADCKPVQPNGPCYQPDNIPSHASFAFNSYWQKKKQAGGTCDFGGTAMLVTVDPSFNGCHFDLS